MAPFLCLGMLISPHLSNSFLEVIRNAMLARPAVGDVVFRFVVGGDLPNNTQSDVMKALAEKRRSRDVVVLESALDALPARAARNCACLEKLHGWFVYALQHWPQATYYAKTEDDTYINLAALLFDLRRPAVQFASRLVYGLMGVASNTPLSSTLISRKSPRTCYFGNAPADTLWWKIRHKWKGHIGAPCHPGLPAPFPYGFLAVFSSTFARELFDTCEYVKEFMSYGRAANRRSDSCHPGHPLKKLSQSATTCDGAIAGWFEVCLRRLPGCSQQRPCTMQFADMTWTKGHDYHGGQIGAGAYGWTAPSLTSLAVHDLKEGMSGRPPDSMGYWPSHGPGAIPADTNGFRKHKALWHVHTVTRDVVRTSFPPLVWAYTPQPPILTHHNATQFSDMLESMFQSIDKRLQAWYWRVCPSSDRDATETLKLAKLGIVNALGNEGAREFKTIRSTKTGTTEYDLVRYFGGHPYHWLDHGCHPSRFNQIPWWDEELKSTR